MNGTLVTIAPATTIGAVHLTVADLERSIAYYEQAIGLSVLERAGGQASLGAGVDELVVLVEQPGARPADGYSGLFHTAFLLPDRVSLARWLAHVARERIPISGASDHFVSEAVYLSDPDHHGIEVYADRPRALWEGQVARMTTERLDTDSLFAELDDPTTEPFDGQPSGSRIGHVHLRVADVPAAIAFYRELLGFELMAALADQAAFLGAGGYHHHIGANVWESRGRGQAPAGSAALRHATIVLPTSADRDQLVARVAEAGQEPEIRPDGTIVRDPSGNALLLTAAE
jgi:catechol 2,3-dioxygenase